MIVATVDLPFFLDNKKREFTRFVFLSIESHDDNHLSKERIEILNHVRIARVRIEHLRLNNLNNDRESPSHSSFGRTNKSKRAS